ncbi:MAG: prepilin peptidase [Chthoniobacteraceae bacterium]
MQPLLQPFAVIFQIFAFIFGAIVGSFLNVVIYRLPLGLSVNEPRRSFCPHCKTQIPWHQNIPLFSWLALRGKCARCKAPISFRYFAVELLTGLIFLWVWNRALGLGDYTLALPLWIFLALLISATFIDFDHFIIPDEITLGGTAAGLLLSAIFPGLMEESVFWKALLWSAAGAAAGYLILWGSWKPGSSPSAKNGTSTPHLPTSSGPARERMPNSRWPTKKSSGAKFFPAKPTSSSSKPTPPKWTARR